MKFFAVVVVLCTFASAIKAGMTKQEALEAFRGIADNCMKETGATEADFDVMINHEPAQNRETKCLRSCVMKKINVISEDGKFVKDIAMKIAELHSHGDPKKIQIAEEVTSVCKDIAVPDDHCEAAELYKMCLASETKKHGVKMLD